jgi:hypothetical protein
MNFSLVMGLLDVLSWPPYAYALLKFTQIHDEAGKYLGFDFEGGERIIVESKGCTDFEDSPFA